MLKSAHSRVKKQLSEKVYTHLGEFFYFVFVCSRYSVPLPHNYNVKSVTFQVDL